MTHPPRPAIRQVEPAAVRPLRAAVLRPGQPVDAAAFPGDDDPDTIHVAAIDHLGAIHAIASIYHEPRTADDPGAPPDDPAHERGTAWRMRGVATADDVRDAGLGRAVVERCCELARQRGGTIAWCNARTSALGFYERIGWTVLGPEFDVPGIGPHRVAELALRS